MKKFLLPLIAMLFCMTACNKDNEGILKLEVEQYTTDTKLHLDNNYAAWDNGDAVWVNGTSYAVGVSSNTVSLTGVAANPDGYKAVYPASWVSSSATANSEYIGIKYPKEQTYRKNSAGQQVIDAPMAAYSDGSSLRFRNLGSILAVNVTNNNSEAMIVHKIEVSSPLGEINGTFNVCDITTAPRLQIAMGGDYTTTLTHIHESIAAGSSKTFYIAMPPVATVLTINVYDQYYSYSKSQSTGLLLAANHGYNVPFSTSGITPVQYAPLSNQIWYRTTDYNGSVNAFGNVGTLQSNAWDATIGYYVATYSNNITEIPISSFREVENLKTIILPEGITYMGQQAFYGCTSLTNVVLPYSLVEVGPQIFWGCSVQTIDFPNPNIKLDDDVLKYSNVQTVILHNNNVFVDDLIDDLDGLNEDFQMLYEMGEDPIAFANERIFWHLNSDEDAPFITVYVTDVQACTSISYNCGYVEYLNSDYLYKPWQNLIDLGEIQILPLSSLL